MQSIGHTLRALDRMAEKEQERAGHLQKTLADFQGQAGRPFEYEMRLRELIARQAELNEALDLDKGERQVVPASDGEAEADGSQTAAARERSPGSTHRPERGGSYTARRRPDPGEEPGEEADEAEVGNVPKPWVGPKPGM